MANTIKALEILGLPQECSSFEGQIKTKTTNILNIYEVTDFTSIKRKVYYEFEFVKKTELFGGYLFNVVANYLYSYGHQIQEISENYLETLKPASTFTVNTGPFSGLTYYSGWQKGKIQSNSTANGWVFNVLSEPWLNTNSDGTPSDMTNPLPLPGTCNKYARTKTKSSTGEIKIWTSKYPVTQNLRRSDILNIVQMTEEDYATKVGVTFDVVPVSNKTHITSIAMDIVDSGFNKKTGIFYINGEDTKVVSPSGMITSYGQTYPGHIFQWRLYNGDNQGVYGCTLVQSFTSTEDNTINIAVSTINSYDAVTKTLTYNLERAEEAKLLAYAEFKPAQGKNESIGRMLSLETGIETNW